MANFFTDYAYITKRATEGDLRHAEARHQETGAKSYAKTVYMLQRNIDVTNVRKGYHTLETADVADGPLPGIWEALIATPEAE
jgi:hypothetical protein